MKKRSFNIKLGNMKLDDFKAHVKTKYAINATDAEKIHKGLVADLQKAEKKAEKKAVE